MTIVKHGNPVQSAPEDMIAECSCGCVFTFNEREAIGRYPNNGGGYVWFAKCPECHSTSPTFDSGYPYSDALDRSVKAKHAWLWLFAKR